MKKTTFLLRYTALFLTVCVLILFSSCKDPNAPKTREEKIEEVVEKIKADPAWLSQINAQAEEQDQPLDSLILKNAIYVVEMEENRNKSRDERIKDVVAKIYATPEWIANIRKDAEARNQPLDSMVNNAAIWMIDEEDGKHTQTAPISDTNSVK